MINVGKLLQIKGHELWCVRPDDSVFDAVKMMEEKSIGALPVLLDGKLIGIISERDCARKVILNDLPARETKVKALMTRQVYYTFPEQDVEACLSTMSKRHIRHIPVVENEKVLGLIAMGDVVKDIILEQQEKIDHLEHYISWEESY
ncbi:hypothetical protein MNBD_GAMMA25-2024 [hydrothermal vent metagenome]|uniref:CBS domain-containing protein n=1 Tax=hydrothermal vent metagenome TaxID=652676 RepID=A0A3B1ATC7_9ZZZZ